MTDNPAHKKKRLTAVTRFSSTHQPKNRRPRGKGKATAFKHYLKVLEVLYPIEDSLPADYESLDYSNYRTVPALLRLMDEIITAMFGGEISAETAKLHMTEVKRQIRHKRSKAGRFGHKALNSRRRARRSNSPFVVPAGDVVLSAQLTADRDCLRSGL